MVQPQHGSTTVTPASANNSFCISSSGATVDSTLVSAAHDRQRRSERHIQKIDLQRARRYGMAEHQTNGRIKYTYGGFVFIYCPIMNAAVTSWKV